MRDNERLEFLGDAMIDAVISRWLFEMFPDAREGNLTRMRSSLVSESALFARGQEVGLGEFLRLGKGEERSGGRERPSIVSSAFEAIMAAVYLDGGYEALHAVLRKTVGAALEELTDPDATDYKSRLQNSIQGALRETPVYRVNRTEGPDHEKIFYVELVVRGQALSVGSGRNKKEASQAAARFFLEKLESSPDLLQSLRRLKRKV